MRLDMRDDAVLEKPLYLPAVHRIARQAINLPAHNTLRFAALYPRHHVGKDGAAGHLCRLLFDKLLRNF